MSNLIKPTFIDPSNGTPKPVDTSSDAVAANGFYPQITTTPDQVVSVTRTGGELVLADMVAGSKTLSHLVDDPQAGQKKPAVARRDYYGRPPPALPSEASPTTFTGTVYYVGTAPGDYATVSAALVVAVAGDIIEVRAGYTVTETVTVSITKSIEIRGANRSTSIVTGNVAGPLFNVVPGVNDVYVHTMTVRNTRTPTLDAGTVGVSSCITANTMTEAYQAGSTGLYFYSLNVVHPRIGIAVSGASFVIKDCSFACNTVSPGISVRSIVNYGQTGNCHVHGCSVTATTLTTCFYVTAVNPGTGTFVPGHEGNLVFKNVTESGTCAAYYLQDVIHEPGARNSTVYALPAGAGKLGLWFDNCTFAGQWSDYSISLQDNISTTIASGSNNQTLTPSGPTGIVYVSSVAGFPMAGSFRVRTAAGLSTVSYTNRLPSGQGGPRFLGCTVTQDTTFNTGNNVWSTDTLNFFTRIVVNNCSGASRTTGSQKGFITLDPTVGATREIGAPTVAVWAFNTNVFNSTLPSATYANATTTASLLGYATARYNAPTSLLDVIYPIYVPTGVADLADGIQVAPGDRVMLVNTYDAKYSGLYNVSSSMWTRCVDMADGVHAAGYYWWVTGGGEEYGNTGYVVGNSPDLDIVGQVPLSFVDVGQGGGSGSLQDAYDNSTPAVIELANGKTLEIYPADGATAGFTLEGAGTSSLIASSNANLTVAATGTGSLLLAGAAGVSITSTAGLTLDATAPITVGNTSGANSLYLYGGASSGGQAFLQGRVISIGGANSTVLIIGSATGITQMSLQGNNNAIDFGVTGASLYDLDIDANGAGAVSINAANAAINVGNDAVNQPINVGTGGNRTIAIGKSGGTSALALYPATLSINGSQGSSGQVLTSNGTSVAPTWSSVVNSLTGSSNIAVSASTGSVTVSLTGAVPAINGGTAQTTYTTGDVLYSSATNTLSKRAIGTTGQALVVSGGLPTWGTVETSGGGTGQTTYTTGDVLYSSATNTLSKLSIGTTGQILTVSGGVPTWADGLTKWGDSLDTLLIYGNNVRPVVSLYIGSSVSSVTYPDVDAAITPRFQGALLGQSSDNSVSGGSKRGIYATDWQRVRSSANEVAAGQYSTVSGGKGNRVGGSSIYGTVSGGLNNRTLDQGGVVGGGTGNLADGFYSTIAGGNVNEIASTANKATIGGGGTNYVNAHNGTIPGGFGANTRGVQGRFSFASNSSGGGIGPGKEQMGMLVLRASVGFTGTVNLSSSGNPPDATTANALPDNSAYAVQCFVVAKDTNGVTAAWELKGVVKRGVGAGTIAAVGSFSSTLIGSDGGVAAQWNAVLSTSSSHGTVDVAFSNSNVSPATVAVCATMYTTELVLP